MDSQDKSYMNQKEAVIAELLKQKVNEAHELVSQYNRGLSMYIIITGGLLKFALDQNATVQLRNALASMGIGLSLLGLLACYFGLRINRIMRNDINNFVEYLGIPNLASSVLPLKYITVVVITFVMLSFVGWCYIVVNSSNH